MEKNLGVNEFTPEELAELFRDEDTQTPPSATQETTPPAATPAANEQPSSVETTKAFAKRLAEVTDKKVNETREQVAKEAGYNSYADMIKAKETKMLTDKGLNPEDVSPVIEELVKTRLDQDPRIKELEEVRKQRVQEFAKRELGEISKLTNGEITTLEQLPKEVIEIWKTTGSLKAAFLQVKGEELILKAAATTGKGSTTHLASPSGTTTPTSKTRPLTDEEKRTYKYFNPNITDEELNKKVYSVE